MPSAFRTPKNLAEWLRLDYFRFPRQLPRLRRALCWATLSLCIGFVGAAYGLSLLNEHYLHYFHDSEAMLYEAGPLTSVHANFNNDCGKCHQDSFATAARFLPWKQHVSSVPDSACLNCHK